jgi:hypothetical protein
MDIYAPLLNGTYYDNTLKFLFTEYYNCYKTQNEVISSLPNGLTVNDKEFEFTMDVLYANAYAKKLIIKEILDLTIYNATFLKNIEAEKLLKKQNLQPNPRVEELSGGGGSMILQAVLFFAFVSLYRATSNIAQSLSPFCGPDTICTGEITIPTKLQELQNGVANPYGAKTYEPYDQNEFRRFTQLYGDSYTKIKDERQLESADVEQMYKEKFNKNLPYNTQIQTVLLDILGMPRDQFTSYVQEETEQLNKLIIELYQSLNDSCESMTQLTQNLRQNYNIDPLVETYIEFNKDLKYNTEKFAKPELEERLKSRRTAEYESVSKEFLDTGVNPGDNSFVTNVEATGESMVDMGTRFISYLSNRNKQVASNKQLSASDKKKLREEFVSKVSETAEENLIPIAEQEEANIVEATMTLTTKKMFSEHYTNLLENNRNDYLNNFCSNLFGNVPKVSFSSSSGKFTLSDSAETFSIFSIILNNIEKHKKDMLNNVNIVELTDKSARINSLIEKVGYLKGLVTRYNTMVYQFMTQGHKQSETIDKYFDKIKNTVSTLTRDVKLATHITPLVERRRLKEIADAEAKQKQQNMEDQQKHKLNMETSALNTQMWKENWDSFQDSGKVFVSGVIDFGGATLGTATSGLLNGTEFLIYGFNDKIAAPLSNLINTLTWAAVMPIVTIGLAFLGSYLLLPIAWNCTARLRKNTSEITKSIENNGTKVETNSNPRITTNNPPSRPLMLENVERAKSPDDDVFNTPRGSPAQEPVRRISPEQRTAVRQTSVRRTSPEQTTSVRRISPEQTTSVRRTSPEQIIDPNEQAMQELRDEMRRTPDKDRQARETQETIRDSLATFRRRLAMKPNSVNRGGKKTRKNKNKKKTSKLKRGKRRKSRTGIRTKRR